ncbi:MAG: YbjN domain-containing protein [Gemmatimonadetes bacterium]|nr:YbjN domain-containing protein [Gemmatimonadota bacterium]
MAITFETEPQRATYERVATILRDEFGKQATPHPERPLFMLRTGSAMTQVHVDRIGDAASVVRALSWVVTGAEQSGELHKFLLEANLSVRFGAFAIDGAGDIMFTHAIVGEGLTSDALMFTVVGVAQIADEYDDLIVQRFGGQRSSDRA